MKLVHRSFCLVLGCLAALTVHSANITVKGSDTLLILAQKWAEVYMQQHADVKIQVTGGGTGTGFAALQNQTTDLCDASRKAKPGEIINCIKAFNAPPKEYQVAIDGLTVYVNPTNPLHELTVAQIGDIFTGKIKNWKEVGGPDQPITLYSRENSSGSYEFFKEHVLHGHDFAPTVQTMPGTAAILQAVGSDLNGIGYGGVAYGNSAKHLAVKPDAQTPGIEPTEENVVGKRYPIWRPLFVYVNPALDRGEIHDYLAWIRSPDGQKIVEQVGYFPLPANLQSH